MIRPVDITNAGNLLFQFALLLVVHTYLVIPFWLRFMFIAGLLLSLSGTVIYALELPAKAEEKAKKGKSLQAACQDEHISYFRTPRNVGNNEWKDVFGLALANKEFFDHMSAVPQ